uniref:uncharacterized protein LOC120333227 n=1 Tax=Styela clava TaxID=7725 RepID=UPI0019392899|nr:uncharacterized protein LOC120333227 [Styela clava]
MHVPEIIIFFIFSFAAFLSTYSASTITANLDKSELNNSTNCTNRANLTDTKNSTSFTCPEESKSRAWIAGVVIFIVLFLFGGICGKGNVSVSIGGGGFGAGGGDGGGCG